MRSLSLLLAGAAVLMARSTAAAEPTPAPTGSNSADKETAATDITVPSKSFFTVTVVKDALTTTFTPPAVCSSSRLTQLASPGYQIWLHEPMPVGGTRIGECYPPQFATAYASVANMSSSVAPLMSPLVCPKGWHTARKWDDGYIACCADGYLLRPPDGPLADPSRPAYGGTCYSNFGVGKTVTVTAWDNAEPTATAEWSASVWDDQAYGHVIDGYALDLISNTNALTPETNKPISEDSDKSTGLSGGVIAGIVIGSLAGAALILVGALLLIRRRGRAQQQTPNSDHPRNHSSRHSDEVLDKTQAGFYVSDRGVLANHGSVHSTNLSAMSSPTTVVGSGTPVSGMGGQTRHELGSTAYMELEGGYNRHEVC